jgi:hypothetical protein
MIFFAEWVHRSGIEFAVNVQAPLCFYRLHAESESQRNLTNPAAVAKEEWEAMNLIASLTGDSTLRFLFRRFLFAARSRVKAATATQGIEHHAKQFAGPTAWMAGCLAVWLRSAFRRIL